ncbi:MAG: hypothetical protein HYR64_03885 [Fimbriimonas ginsengisoli]|uniref:Tetratricopeptide repeat protein n=1 Tax=Fimbriimonas ginsengisoli TaxID=1005039 RepID=A0A931LRP0_FIMGI|nr:hypothetical protein [Fimbriimonas ginsengisoli]MBI3744827.1 hypothetical protein [Chloroflexota bacterium]
MRATFVFVLVVVATLACAQGGAEPSRVDAIMDVAFNWMDRQVDIWYEDGDYPRDVQLLRMQNALRPSDYGIADTLGYMLENVERMDEALAVYVGFRKANAAQADGPFPEANFYFQQKLYAKVPALLEPSLALKPHANSFRVLAHSYERLNLLSDSERVWKAYLALAPGDDPARKNLARVQQKLKSAPTGS